MLGKTKLQSLISKSEGILSIFEKTKNDIIIVNNEIDKETKIKCDQISLLEEEFETLTIQKVKNEKILTNIDKFFE